MLSPRTLFQPDARMRALEDGERPVRNDELGIDLAADVPRPVQAGHAPKGLLNENIRGVSSSMDTPQSSQA